MTGATFAPAAIARVASWPFDVLSALADEALADQADDACAGRLSWSTFEAAYDASVAAERERLWRLTRGDKQFLLALAFANPCLAERVTSVAREALSNRRRRRLDRTLYRYLARAAGRPQPLGLWSGVALVRWGETTRITPAAPALRVEPDLRPFFTLVHALACHAVYRQRGPWQVNPSLDERPDGSWTFWVPTPGGTEVRSLQPAPGAQGLLRRLVRFGPESVDVLMAAIAAPDASGARARATVETLVETGLLVGGLQPPWRFDTPREALGLIEDALVAHDRERWRAARLEVNACCRRLEEKGGDLDVADVLSATNAVQREITNLAVALGVPCPALPGTLLRCDLTSPVNVELGGDIRSRLEHTLAEYLRFQGAYGFGGPLRQALVSRYLPPGQSACCLNAVPPPAPSAPAWSQWEDLGLAIGAGADFSGCLARWHDLLADGQDRVVAHGGGENLAPPHGWLQVGFDAPPGKPAQVIVHGVFDDLWAPYARHAPSWTGNSTAGDLQNWLRGGVSECAAESGITLAEMVAPCYGNPNALARPRLGAPVVSPWSCAPDALDLRGASIALDAERGALFLVLPGRPGRIAVLNTASADVQSGDPVVQLLLATSFGATPGPVLQAASLAFAEEVDAERCSPEVVLPGGAIVRTRRSVLGGDVVQKWSQADPARRFAEWTRFISRRRLPALLLARRQDGLTLPMHRASPLAVAALVEGSGACRLTIEQMPGTGWLDDGGQGRVAELAVPFRRAPHIWSRRS